MAPDAERAAQATVAEPLELPMVVGPGACPWMGLRDDPTVMLAMPSDSHRCFAVSPEREPRLDYQMRYCLGPAHQQCATYQAAEQRVVASFEPRTKPRTSSRKRTSHRGVRWFVIGAATMLLLAAAAGYGVLGFPGLRGVFPAMGGVAQNTGEIPTLVAAAAPVGAAIIPSETPTPEPRATSTEEENTQLTEGAATAASSALAAASGAAGTSPDSATVASVTTGSAAVSAAAAARKADAAADFSTPTNTATKRPTASPKTATPIPDSMKIAVAAAAAPVQEDGTPTPTSTPMAIKAMGDQIGWWRSGDSAEFEMGDSFLNVGQLGGDAYISAMRLPLTAVPRGAPLIAGWLELTGLSTDHLDPNIPGTWLVELIAERQLSSLSDANFMMVFSAPDSITLPVLRASDLSDDGVNRLPLDDNSLRWLEQQRIAGANSVTARLVAQVDGKGDNLFAWDSGTGPLTRGNGPVLWLQTGSAPPTPPPIPTEDLPVATFTPAPQNLVTLVAQQATATFVAQTTGTYTPEPPFATPTSVARSLPTAQAISRNLGLPAVVVETPVPANEATVTAVAEYATAVAVTTGTYTPVPTLYVTPQLVPGPVPVGKADEDERALAKALEGLNLPYNAVIAQWVVATPTPLNVATAAAIVMKATADAEEFGMPTATPWGVLVYTPVPPPEPTATPTTPLVQDVALLTPTPVIEPTETPPAVLPDNMRNMIIFQSNRFGEEQTFAYDPTTGTTARINATWAADLAAKQLAMSPDGKFMAIVKSDGSGTLQIFVRSLEWGSEKQITDLKGGGANSRSYDPAWSPKGDWIAFVSTNSGNDEIYRVSPDGSLIQQLTHNTWEWDKHPTWSPDGSQIVFYSNRDTKRRQIFAMDPDGKNQHQLIESEADDWDPVWTR